MQVLALEIAMSNSKEPLGMNEKRTTFASNGERVVSLIALTLRLYMETKTLKLVLGFWFSIVSSVALSIAFPMHSIKNKGESIA